MFREIEIKSFVPRYKFESRTPFEAFVRDLALIESRRKIVISINERLRLVEESITGALALIPGLLSAK